MAETLNVKYWESVSRHVLNNHRAKVGYKVVAGVRSFTPATPNALQRIRYKLNQITRREKDEYGCFAVFTSYAKAREFLAHQGTHIVLVGYTLCSSRGRNLHMWKKGVPSFVKNRWKGGGYHAEAGEKQYLLLKDAPKGTVLAEEIYIIGIIE